MSVSALVGGCGLGAAKRPDAVLAAYAEALSRRDSAHAYRLLSTADRKAIDQATYARLLSVDAREAGELAERLSHAGPSEVTAHVALDDGSELWLVLEGDHFVVLDPLRRFYGQGSPREALRSFVRAVEHERWDVLLALMPNVERAELDPAALSGRLAARREELTRMTALLRSALDAPIEVVGDRATMPYGESYTARLVREDQLWKLEDPD